MEHLAWTLLAAIASGFGGYFGAYLKKKGENLAVREDIEDLKVQTAELTKTAKEIEAKISEESWNRQRQWELTRDAAVKLMEAHARLEDAGDEVVRTHSVSRRDLFAPQPGPLEASAALEAWRTARRAMIDVLGLLSFACFKKETSSAINAYKAEELVNSFNALKRALHRELRLQEKESLFLTATPQSSGSSAGPSPG
jgi:hypothetical protein